MTARKTVLGRAAWIAALTAGLGMAPSGASAATGFGQLSGPNGCLVAPGQASEDATAHCGVGKALVGASAVAISPDGANVYVASGTTGTTVAASFGSVAILKRDPATGSIAEVGCLSSDGTDGRDGASGACTVTPSLLGADGVTVSPDGLTVFVTADMSASVVAFRRDPATGLLTRLGCFQYHPPTGAECTPANVFPSAAGVLASADGRALYIAAPTLGSISTLTGALVTPPGTGATGATGSTGSTGAGSSPSEASVASIFGVPEPAFLANPCLAVNGYDGACGVGIATQGLDGLALGPGGEQLYAAAPGSSAVDVFTHSTTGTLTETSCLKAAPPPGLCTGSGLLQTPGALAVSPDGKNVYVSDGSDSGGKVDVLTRNPSTGALSDSGCVDFLAKPEKPEEHEAGEEQEEETHEASPPDPCTSVPGLEGVQAVAVTGDGSEVYAIGPASAVVFSRDQSTGKLTEVSCAASEDSRCTSFPSLGAVTGTAVSPDGRFVYIADSKSNAVLAFGVGLTVASTSTVANRAGVASVRVECPRGLRRLCTGKLELTRAVLSRSRHGRHRVHVRRLAAGGSGRFTVRPGARAIISVRLSPAARQLLLTRHRLPLMAIVHARPFAGGSGFGRRVRFILSGG